jgi:PhnB protein
MTIAAKPLPAGYHTVTPHLITADASRVIEFLQQVFGAVERYRLSGPKGRILHAELYMGDSVIMVAEAAEERTPMPASCAVYVDNVDETYRRAMEAGAQALREPADQFYGDRIGGVRDLAGNYWWIATHIEEVPPDEIKLRAERWLKERTRVER